MPTRIDMSLDNLVATMPHIRPPSYLGTPVQESLHLESGVSIMDFIMGGFISLTARRTVVPLTVGLDFGGVLRGLVHGPNGNIHAILHTRGRMYCLCEDVTEIGQPVYQVGANALHRRLTMQPLDATTSIKIGTLAAVQPVNGVAHIEMVGAGAKPFTAFHGSLMSAR